MKRAEILSKLKAIKGLLVGDLCLNYDLGLEFKYATKDGAGIDWGYNVGQWPVVRIKDQKLYKKWHKIINKINEGKLSFQDLKGTQLQPIAEEAREYCPEVNRRAYYSDFFKELATITQEEASEFYVFFDFRHWELDDLEVYPNYEKAEEGFLKTYGTNLTSWDSMDDERLQEWYDLIFVKSKLEDMPYLEIDLSEYD